MFRKKNSNISDRRLFLSYGYKFLSCVLPAFGVAACDSDPVIVEPEPIPEPEPEPEPKPDPVPTDTVKIKALAIQPDWSEALEEEHIPTAYNLFVGDTAIVADAHTLYMYKDSASTADYPVLAYNEPEGISIEDNTASIHRTEEGLLEALPGYLFAADTTATVAAGDTAWIPLRMHRLITPVTLTLRFTEAIEVKETRATLSGLVPAIHLPDGKPAEDNAARASSDRNTTLFDVEPLSGGEGIVMRLRTFGILPELKQILKATVTLADGRTLTFQSDLTDELSDLEHLAPIQLESTLDTAKPEEPEPEPEPEPDPEIPIDVSGKIEDWETITGDDIEATM